MQKKKWPCCCYRYVEIPDLFKVLLSVLKLDMWFAQSGIWPSLKNKNVLGLNFKDEVEVGVTSTVSKKCSYSWFQRIQLCFRGSLFDGQWVSAVLFTERETLLLFVKALFFSSLIWDLNIATVITDMLAALITDCPTATGSRMDHVSDWSSLFGDVKLPHLECPWLITLRWHYLFFSTVTSGISGGVNI